ncbi:MAG TPA: ATPase, T2SS/T4P/T4SS family [Kofleriaceae bacterium]|nr:ATPase, T2SS/T4P/T4SS family [Kofleriaceae bacterium]
MFTIIIQEKGGEQRRMVFNKPEVTIGRVQGNDIVLPKGNVSKRHARIVLKDGKFIIVDLKSTNGTYVNGRKITSPLVVKDTDKIYIGDFIVGVDEAANAEGDGPSETTTSPPNSDRLNQLGGDARPPRPTEAAPQPMPIPMGGGLGGMGGGMGAPDRLERDVPPPAMASPSPMPSPRPMGGPPRPPGALGGPPREPPQPREPRDLPPRDMPPVAPPPSNLGRPPGVRPGGTMPPPLAPIGAPLSTPAAPPPAMAPEPHFPPAPAPLPPPSVAPVAAVSPAIAPAPAPSAAPAPVVPLKDQGRGRPQPVATPARKVSRSVSPVAKRGVALEPLDSKIVKMLDLQSNILERLRAKLDLDKVPVERLHEEDLWQKAERETIHLVEMLETSGELPKYIDQDALIKETLNEALALGPLEDLFADESIDEILIDRRDRVVVGKNGQLRGSGKAFSSDEVFERVVKRLVHEAGAVIDEAHPVVDMRMRDGTRLTAAVSPVAARGACLVLKKPASQSPSLSDLVSQGTLSSGMADFLTACINARRNILVCGGPASGKTALVGALASASPAGERVVSIEDVAELAIGRDEWIQLETRPANSKGGEVDLATLLETALRLMPDRLVVGEVRGREAMPLVQALSSSVDGAVVAVTGEGAMPVLSRIATLARATQPAGADAAIRELVATAFEIVVHVARTADGALRVQSIEEVTGVSDSTFETDVVFHLKDGSFAASGKVPTFYSAIGGDQAVFR